MKNPTENSFPALMMLFVFLALACNKDDPCRSTFEGIVSDELSEELLDSVEIAISEVKLSNIISSDPIILLPATCRVDTRYTSNGAFELEFECDEEKRYNIVFSSSNHYSYRESFTFTGSNYFREITLCPASFLELDLTNRFGSDRLVYTFDGFQCDNPDKTIGYSTSREYSSDTTEIISLPVSASLSINLKSYQNDFLQVDTTVQFEILKDEVTKIELEY